VIEGDEWRHLRAKALEALATRLLAAARLAEAEGAARAAMRVDPLRETPHGILIRIQLAGGNQSDAIESFGDYRRLLHDALGLEPTAHLCELMPAARD
jgi:DNA-binding SARP family transcriptional activator